MVDEISRYPFLLKPLHQICFQINDKNVVEKIDAADSEDDKLPEEKYVEAMAREIPQGTNKTPDVLTQVLSPLPPK